MRTRMRIAFSFTLLSAVTLVSACGGSSKPQTLPPTTPATAAEEANQPTPVSQDSASSDAMAREEPPSTTPTSSADPALIAKGAAIFEEYCSICHGEAGAGTKKSPKVKFGGTNDEFPNADTLFAYTKEKMPKDDPGSLSDDEYKAVVAWMQN